MLRNLYDLEMKYWKLQPSREKMQKILDSEPQKVCEKAIEKWNELGPLNLEEIIAEGKIEYDESKDIKVLHKYKGYNKDYFG